MDILDAVLAAQIAKNGSGGGGGAVSSVNGKTGAVVLVADDLGAEPEKFIVRVTESSGTYSADKTFAEISAAYESGKSIEVIYGGTIYYLVSLMTPLLGDGYIAFSFTHVEGNSIRIFRVEQDDSWEEYGNSLVTASRQILVGSASATITPISNTIYSCGELTSLTITDPPATGAYVIKFTSGSTATTTTIPASIIFPEAFAAEANTRYEINVEDGYAVAVGWPVS